MKAGVPASGAVAGAILVRGDTEVGDTDGAASVDHHVGRLEIAMKNSACVRGREPAQQLDTELSHLGRAQPPDTREKCLEILPVHQLHGEKMLTIAVFHVVDATHRRMRDLARQTDFFDQAPDRFRRCAMDDFQRDLDVEARVQGPIHFTRHTAAELRDDAVAAREHVSRVEPRACPIIRSQRDLRSVPLMLAGVAQQRFDFRVQVAVLSSRAAERRDAKLRRQCDQLEKQSLRTAVAFSLAIAHEPGFP
jgi:hypothetical protein